MSYDPFAPESPVKEPRGPSVAQITLGAILIVLGAAWLLAALDIATIPWRGLLAAALIVVGLVVAAMAGRERHGGIMAIGVILTIVLALASTAEGILDAPLAGGIGERDFAPRSFDDLESEYRLLIGDLDVDLQSVTFPAGETTVQVSVMIGQAIVHTPDEVAVAVDAKVTGGEVVLFDQSQNGFDVDATYADAEYAAATNRLRLEITGGFGRLEVE